MIDKERIANAERYYVEDMHLRDEFAKLYVTSMEVHSLIHTPALIATYAYQFADAMMEERAK